MPQLIIPGCFQVAINASSGTQDVVNVIGVRNASGTAAAAAAAVQTAWKVANGPLSQMAAQYTLRNFRATDIGDPNGSIAELGDTTAGGLPGGSLATNAACALVKWNGATRSKSSRGRLYHGPLTETLVNSDGRTITTAGLTALGISYNAFRASLSSSGYPLVVLSRTLSQAFDVTSSAVETVLATQRRRIRD